MTTTEDVTARVQLGAELLDERRPGWWQEIDLERLDLGNSCDCTAGQQPGGYAGTMNLLGISHTAEAAACGFDSGPEPRDEISAGEARRLVAAEYAALTASWRALIAGRRRQQADDDEIEAELAGAMREVPGEQLARDAGREAWQAHRQQRGGQP